MTGSCNVITLNINRIIQDFCRTNMLVNLDGELVSPINNVYKWEDELKRYLTTILERVYKYHIAFKTILYELEDRGMYSSSNAGYIFLKKLYCTIGVIGYCEAAEFLGYEINNNPEYKSFLKLIFETIQEQNKKNSIHDKKRPFVFNLEAIPKLSGDVKSLLIDSELLLRGQRGASNLMCAA